MKKKMNKFLSSFIKHSPFNLASFSILYYFYYKSCKCYNIVILETDRALFLFLGGFEVIVVEGELGRGAIVFYLLFWVLNEGGGGVRKKYTKHFFEGGFQKLKGKKSKIIIAPL